MKRETCHLDQQHCDAIRECRRLAVFVVAAILTLSITCLVASKVSGGPHAATHAVDR